MFVIRADRISSLFFCSLSAIAASAAQNPGVTARLENHEGPAVVAIESLERHKVRVSVNRKEMKIPAARTLERVAVKDRDGKIIAVRPPHDGGQTVWRFDVFPRTAEYTIELKP